MFKFAPSVQTLGKCHGVGPAFLQGLGLRGTIFSRTSCLPTLETPCSLLLVLMFWNDQVSFQILTIDDLLFLTWLVAEQELADLEKWKQQNRAKPVYSVPQRLGK